MGANESALRKVQLGEPLPSSSQLYKAWTEVCPAVYEADGPSGTAAQTNAASAAQRQQRATVFVRTFGETDSDETKKFFENGIQSLKQLRHPNVLAYCDSSFLETECVLITERVKPLEQCVEDMDSIEILSGLQSICEALIFLQDKVRKCHNNVSPLAVFVTPDGRWKLGGLECSQELEQSRHWVLSDFAKTVKDLGFSPPEDQQMLKTDAPAHARDSYGFGKLMEFLLQYLETSLDDESKELFHSVMIELVNTDPTLRPPISHVNSSSVFRNCVSEILDFIGSLPLKSDAEKQAFFTSLTPRLRAVAPSLIARRLSRPLLSRYVLLEAEAVRCLLPALLTPKGEDSDDGLNGDGNSTNVGLLPMELYKKWIIPELCKVFCVHEKSVRLALLSHFQLYIDTFPTEYLKEVVLPELLLGMKDTGEDMVSASMHCLAALVPVLGAEAVTGLTHRRYFADGRPRSAKLLESVIQPADLMNVKVAMESDKAVNERYDELERKRQREEKLAEKRLHFEQKREERRLRIIAQRKEMEACAGEMALTKIVPSQLDTSDTAASGEENASNALSEEKPTGDDSDPDWVDWDAPQETNVTTASEPTLIASPTEVTSAPNASSQIEPPATSTTIAAAVAPQPSHHAPVVKKPSSGAADLGAEFAIAAAGCRAKRRTTSSNGDDDFFADMTPVVTRSATAVVVVEANDEMKCAGDVKPKIDEKILKNGTQQCDKPRNLFQVAAMDEIDSGQVSSWLEDGELDVEDDQ